MSYTTAIQATSAADLKVTVIIDGVPILFGTEKNLTLDTSDLFRTGYPASLTSNNALGKDIKIGGATLDYETLIVPYSTGSITIRSPMIDETNWQRYFERRTTPQTRLLDYVDILDTDFPVGASTSFSAGNTAYVDRETVLIDSVSAGHVLTTPNGRNYASLAGESAQTHGAGAVLAHSPRYLIGRHVVMHLWASDTDSTIYRRFKIDTIDYDKKTGIWSIGLKDVMAMLDRQIAVGFDEQGIESFTYVPDDEQVIIAPANDQDRVYLPSVNPGHLMVSRGDQYVIVNIATFTSPSAGVYNPTVYHGDLINRVMPGSFAGWGNSMAADDTYRMKRVCVFTGSPMRAALQVLLSTGGGGENHPDWDTLIGATVTTSGGLAPLSYESEFSFGAGLDPNLIDIDTLSSPALLGQQPPGWCYVLGARGEENLLQFMEEVAWALKGFWYVNVDGKLSFKRLSALFPNTEVAAALNHSNILEITELQAIDDETEAVSSFKIECNYDAVSGQFQSEVNVNHPATHEIFKESARRIDLQRRGLVINVAGFDRINGGSRLVNPAQISVLTESMYKVWARRQDGLRKYSLKLPVRYHLLSPGDIVTVTHEALLDFTGNSLSGQTFEVVSVSGLSLKDGFITIEIHETFAAKIVSPTSRIASWNAGTATMTLNTNDKYGSGSTPGQWWAVGWKVRILDASAASPYGTASNVLTVSARDDTTVTVTGVVGFTPTTGDVLVQAQYDNSDNTTENVATGTAQRDHSFQSEDYRLGASDVAADTWG